MTKTDQESLTLKEKLAAVDLGYAALWEELSEEERKDLKGEFFILNRYVSNVEGESRKTQEHYVQTVNSYFNKYWNDLQKHPKLLWQLLCMCRDKKNKVYFHKWIGYKKADTASNKIAKFLTELYPNLKDDEIKILAKLTTKQEAKQLAKEYGMSDAEIAKKF